jgi:hypothetical protein
MSPIATLLNPSYDGVISVLENRDPFRMLSGLYSKR